MILDGKHPMISRIFHHPWMADFATTGDQVKNRSAGREDQGVHRCRLGIFWGFWMRKSSKNEKKYGSDPLQMED